MRRIGTMIRTTLVALAVSGVAVTLSGGSKASTVEEPQKTAVCTLKVTGMTCGGCAAAVKSAAKKVGGVKDAKVSYEKGLAEVTYDPAKTSPNAIAQAITKRSGFKAEVQAPKGK